MAETVLLGLGTDAEILDLFGDDDEFGDEDFDEDFEDGDDE